MIIFFTYCVLANNQRGQSIFTSGLAGSSLMTTIQQWFHHHSALIPVLAAKQICVYSCSAIGIAMIIVADSDRFLRLYPCMLTPISTLNAAEFYRIEGRQRRWERLDSGQDVRPLLLRYFPWLSQYWHSSTLIFFLNDFHSMRKNDADSMILSFFCCLAFVRLYHYCSLCHVMEIFWLGSNPRRPLNFQSSYL